MYPSLVSFDKSAMPDQHHHNHPDNTIVSYATSEEDGDGGGTVTIATIDTPYLSRAKPSLPYGRHFSEQRLHRLTLVFIGLFECFAGSSLLCIHVTNGTIRRSAADRTAWLWTSFAGALTFTSGVCRLLATRLRRYTEACSLIAMAMSVVILVAVLHALSRLEGHFLLGSANGDAGVKIIAGASYLLHLFVLFLQTAFWVLFFYDRLVVFTQQQAEITRITSPST